MGLFSNAKDNFEKRQQIAEWNYRTREYISEAERIYQEAYDKLQESCIKVSIKVNDYVNYKQKLLNEINSTLKKLDSDNKEFQLTSKVDFLLLEASAITQHEQLNCIDKMLATWVTPSVTDLFHNVSTEEYYMAKQNMYQAKAYKETMKAKREELRNAKYAVQSIPDFISTEKNQIEELMQKFRKTAENLKSSNTEERTKSLCDIAKIIADSLSTQFINNNYEITSQYTDISKRISGINSSLAGAAWLIGG